MSQSQETLDSLASKIFDHSKAITTYLSANGLRAPSFESNNVAEYPPVPELQEARLMLIESLMDMLHLAMGGSEYIFTQTMVNKHDSAVINVLNQFDFFSAVPLEGSASYADISRRTQLPEAIVRRILRHAMTSKLFAETEAGSDKVVHTAATAYVVRNPTLRSWVAHNLEEMEPASAKLPEALRKFSFGKQEEPEEPENAAFGLGHLDEHGKPRTLFEFLQNDGEGDNKGYRMPRFAEMMQVASKASHLNPEMVQRGFDWGGLGEATVVDVGGSSGHDAVALAKTFPNLKLIVEDLPSVEPAFRAYVPAELGSRVTFQAHDFFQPQPVVADAYFLKVVLHDWSDKYAIKILRSLLPGLRTGARIILCEACSPVKYNEHGVKVLPLPIERMMTSMDLQMLVSCNAKERTVQDWNDLFAKADERFELANVVISPGAAWGLIEILWDLYSELLRGYPGLLLKGVTMGEPSEPEPQVGDQ